MRRLKKASGQSISIHTLRMEGDLLSLPHHNKPTGISIHTLRMEGDKTGGRQRQCCRHFNPHPPHGG